MPTQFYFSQGQQKWLRAPQYQLGLGTIPNPHVSKAQISDGAGRAGDWRKLLAHTLHLQNATR